VVTTVSLLDLPIYVSILYVFNSILISLAETRVLSIYIHSFVDIQIANRHNVNIQIVDTKMSTLPFNIP
jgi:hypothetical protein